MEFIITQRHWKWINYCYHITSIDHKLSHKHDEFKKHLIDCVKEEVIERELQEIEQSANIIQEELIQVLMLIAAGYRLNEEHVGKFQQYFNKT